MLKEIFPCLVACGLVEDNMDAYTMQISGERSYIAGNHDLLEFKDIRRYSLYIAILHWLFLITMIMIIGTVIIVK